MAKEVSFNDYIQKCCNGARNVFEWDNIRLVDGINEDEGTQSYFLFNFNCEPVKRYELTLQEAYDLLAQYSCMDVSASTFSKSLGSILRK